MSDAGFSHAQAISLSLENSKSTGSGASSAALRTLGWAVMFTAIMEIFALIAHLL